MYFDPSDSELFILKYEFMNVLSSIRVYDKIDFDIQRNEKF